VTDLLVRQLLEWIASRPRSYDEAIDAWRSNCPRLAVWDDALSEGLIQVVRNGREGSQVALTSRGAALLNRT
jgi:hypothetical protein